MKRTLTHALLAGLVIGLVAVTTAGAAMQLPTVEGWFRAASGEVANPGYGFRSDSDSGTFLSATGVVNIAAAGTEIAEFDATSVDLTVPLVADGFQAGEYTVTMAYGPTTANHVDSIFYIAPEGYTVTDIDVVWGTAESTGSMDVMVERLQGTEACGSGDDLLSAAVDATGTADTVANGALTATTANLALTAGDRLCADLTATPNEITELTIAVQVIPTDS